MRNPRLFVADLARGRRRRPLRLGPGPGRSRWRRPSAGSSFPRCTPASRATGVPTWLVAECPEQGSAAHSHCLAPASGAPPTPLAMSVPGVSGARRQRPMGVRRRSNMPGGSYDRRAFPAAELRRAGKRAGIARGRRYEYITLCALLPTAPWQLNTAQRRSKRRTLHDHRGPSLDQAGGTLRLPVASGDV